MISIRVLPGLPPYGPPARPFPIEWGKSGREGLVVEFITEVDRWIGNFQTGLGGLEFVAVHPNRQDAVVIAAGDLWVVNLRSRTAERVLPAINAAIEVHAPGGWILSRQGLALSRLGPDGLIWHTRRLSWDGFDQLVVAGDTITGLAWSPLDDQWHPFHVDLASGRSVGGSFSDHDTEGWEALAG